MPVNNSTSRPKNRDQKKASAKVKAITTLKKDLYRQMLKGDISPSAYKKALMDLESSDRKAIIKGHAEPRSQEDMRKYSKKFMSTRSSNRKGSVIKGYAKGGMVNCGASMKPTQKRKK